VAVAQTPETVLIHEHAATADSVSADKDIRVVQALDLMQTPKTHIQVVVVAAQAEAELQLLMVVKHIEDHLEMTW
jgi:hypothetical protein